MSKPIEREQEPGMPFELQAIQPLNPGTTQYRKEELERAGYRQVDTLSTELFTKDAASLWGLPDKEHLLLFVESEGIYHYGAMVRKKDT